MYEEVLVWEKRRRGGNGERKGRGGCNGGKHTPGMDVVAFVTGISLVLVGVRGVHGLSRKRKLKYITLSFNISAWMVSTYLDLFLAWGASIIWFS